MPPATTSSVFDRLARAIAFLCLSNARSSITAPMKLEKSVTSPMVIASTSATSSSRIFFHTDLGT